MTNTVFPTLQTQYGISSISHQQAIAEHWGLPNNEIFQSKDVASLHKTNSITQCNAAPTATFTCHMFKLPNCNKDLKQFLICRVQGFTNNLKLKRTNYMKWCQSFYSFKFSDMLCVLGMVLGGTQSCRFSRKT
jgi:hypothetical protein